MWFRISKNLQDISVEMEAAKGEFQKPADAKKVKDLIPAAYEAAEAVWKEHPEFKTVCLDTYSKEEHNIINQSDSKPKN